MNNTCTCGVKFRDAEDWRDHMPCPGNQLEMLLDEVKWLRIESGEMGDQNALLEMENTRLKLEIEKLNGYLMDRSRSAYREDREWIHSDDLPCSTCGIWECPGAARFKGICPQQTGKTFECHCGCMTVGRENYGKCRHRLAGLK